MPSLEKSSPEQPSGKGYYYAWLDRMCVILGVHTHVMGLQQEPLGCSLALKTGSRGVSLNHRSVLPCTKQYLLTVFLVGDVTNYSLKTMLHCAQQGQEAALSALENGCSCQAFSCPLPGKLPMIDSFSADGPSY